MRNKNKNKEIHLFDNSHHICFLDTSPPYAEGTALIQQMEDLLSHGKTMMDELCLAIR